MNRRSLNLALAGSLASAMALLALPAQAQETEQCYGVAMIPKKLLDDLTNAVSGLELAVGKSQAAQDFADAAGTLVTAAAKVAK